MRTRVIFFALFPLARLALRARLAIASVRLKYAKKITPVLQARVISSPEPAFLLASTKDADYVQPRFESPRFTDFRSFQLNVDWLSIKNEHSVHAQKIGTDQTAMLVLTKRKQNVARDRKRKYCWYT